MKMWYCAYTGGVLQIQCMWDEESATVTQSSSPWDKKNSIENLSVGMSVGQVLSVGDGGSGEGSRNRRTWAEEPDPGKSQLSCHLNSIAVL